MVILFFFCLFGKSHPGLGISGNLIVESCPTEALRNMETLKNLIPLEMYEWKDPDRSTPTNVRNLHMTCLTLHNISKFFVL